MNFIRKNGRVIPLRAGKGGVYSMPKNQKLKRVAKLGAVAGVGAAIGKKFSFASTALAITGGIVSGLPSGRGIKGFLLGQGLGLGLDVASTAANAAHVSGLKATKGQKAKAFVKRELLNTAIGWSALGGTLFANPEVRKKVAQWGAKFARASKLGGI